MKKESWGKRNLVWLIVIFIAIGWSSTLLLLSYDDESSVGDIGKFGDMFGAVNALFSGLAFAGMIYAIRLQSKELSQNNREMEVQNEMLKLQKEELTETRKEFQKQNETLVLQRFETTFFHLLTQHHQILDNLSFKDDKTVILKRNVIVHFSLMLTNNHNGRYSKITTVAVDDAEIHTHSRVDVVSHETGFKAIQQEYDRIFNRNNESILSHYFRNLYHIFKFINQSKEIPKERQQFYASLVVAQLSQEEQLVIFHNMMIPSLGYPKFLFLDKRFDILGNMSKKKLEQYSWQIDLFDFLKGELPDELNLNEKSDLRPSFLTE